LMVVARRLPGRIVLFATVAAMMAVVVPEPAPGATCASVCAQVQRSCKKQDKAEWKIARFSCRQSLPVCDLDCDTNAATCPTDCDDDQSLCDGNCNASFTEPELADCLASCTTDHGDCIFACENCGPLCKETYVVCVEQAKQDRTEAKEGCVTARSDCLGVCVDPIDSNCAKQCKSGEKNCGRDASQAYGQCKRSCPTGTAKRACVKQCKNDHSVARGQCSADSIICLGGPAPSCVNP